MSIVSGYKKFKKYILTSSGFQLVSHWTKANTLEFDDGKTAQDKLGAIDGISSSKDSSSDKIAASTKLVSELNSNLQWQKIGELSGTTTKNIDFSEYKEIYLLTRCSGNPTLAYSIIIPVAALISSALQYCNGGYTSGTGAQCAWNVSISSCQLMACNSGGTNYTGSNTIIYAR